MAARSACRLVLLGTLTLVGVAAHAAPAPAVAPCATADETCVVTPSTSDPQWTTVPALSEDGTPGKASTMVPCPGGSWVAGADWTASPNAQLEVDLELFLNGWPPPVAVFDAFNKFPQATTFAAFAGCVDASATAAGAAAVKHRVKTLPIRPGTRRTASSSCRRGERQLRGGAAVLFDSRPTRAELRDHDYRYTVGVRRVRVRLSAGMSVGDDERVTLQVHSACR
jgi:hypothetical protein